MKLSTINHIVILVHRPGNELLDAQFVLSSYIQKHCAANIRELLAGMPFAWYVLNTSLLAIFQYRYISMNDM